ncbi:MAG: hypothetical protein WCJ61_16595, partial [Paludibacter sp.]
FVCHLYCDGWGGLLAVAEENGRIEECRNEEMNFLIIHSFIRLAGGEEASASGERVSARGECSSAHGN